MNIYLVAGSRHTLASEIFSKDAAQIIFPAGLEVAVKISPTLRGWPVLLGPDHFNVRSVFRLTGDFRNARIIQNLHGGAIADFFPILQHPDDFLVRRDFNELGAFAVFAARGEDGIAIGQPGATLGCGGELVIGRQVRLAIEFPNRFVFGIDFAGETVLFVSDQSIAVF